MANKVVLNLPSHPNGQPPSPEDPVITIDGKEIKHVTGVSVKCGAGEFTEVIVSFYAEVSGTVLVEEVTITEGNA